MATAVKKECWPDVSMEHAHMMHHRLGPPGTVCVLPSTQTKRAGVNGPLLEQSERECSC